MPYVKAVYDSVMTIFFGVHYLIVFPFFSLSPFAEDFNLVDSATASHVVNRLYIRVILSGSFNTSSITTHLLLAYIRGRYSAA